MNEHMRDTRSHLTKIVGCMTCLTSKSSRVDPRTTTELNLSRQIGKNQVLAVELGRLVNLHRWRHTQNSDPVKRRLIENVYKLQKQVLSSTDKVTSQSSMMESKKKLLIKLKHEVSNQASVESIKSQLVRRKSNHQEVNEEIKANDLE
jgi:hypothetical protein